MKDTMMGDCRTDCRQSSGKKKVMKEGDYLRLKIDLDDDDDTTGCVSMMFRHHSSSRSGGRMPRRSKSTDSVSSTSPHIKFTEKMMRLFRPSHSDHVVESKQKLAAAAAAKECQPPRRRYMRVVTDRHAPPPDKSNDNPNIIAHYSQEYLQKYYAEKQAKGDERMLPYVVSDTSIMKKSSTDPTGDRRAVAALESTIGASEKHATFNDVVTVFDSFRQTVTEERLHGSVDDSDAESVDSQENSDGAEVKDFFLESDSVPAADSSSRQPVAEEEVQMAQEAHARTAEEARTVEDDVDSSTDVSQCAAMRRQPQAMQNIFATFSAPPDLLGIETQERRAAPVLRKVDLKSVVEQSRAIGGGLRDD